jgi:hypothetical protein
MFKNSKGEKDAILTITIIAFVVVITKFLLSGVSLGGFSFGEVDSSSIAALLTPTLGSYVARQYTDKKHDTQLAIAQAQESRPEDRIEQ